MYWRTEAVLVMSKNGVQCIQQLFSELDYSDAERNQFYKLLKTGEHNIHEATGTEVWYWDSNNYFSDDLYSWLDTLLPYIHKIDFKFIIIDGCIERIHISGLFNPPFRVDVSYSIAIEQI